MLELSCFGILHHLAELVISEIFQGTHLWIQDEDEDYRLYEGVGLRTPMYESLGMSYINAIFHFGIPLLKAIFSFRTF